MVPHRSSILEDPGSFPLIVGRLLDILWVSREVSRGQAATLLLAHVALLMRRHGGLQLDPAQLVDGNRTALILLGDIFYQLLLATIYQTFSINHVYFVYVSIYQPFCISWLVNL